MLNSDQIAVTIVVKFLDFLLAQLGEWLKARRVKPKHKRKLKPRRCR
jgi:hypothetical protein